MNKPRIFIDRTEIEPRSISAGYSQRGKWISLDFDWVPTKNNYQLSVIFQNGAGVELECVVSSIDEYGNRLAEPHFYPISTRKFSIAQIPETAI